MAILVSSFLVISATSVSCYSLFAAQIRHKIQSVKWQNRFNKASGSLLIGAGVLTAAVKH